MKKRLIALTGILFLSLIPVSTMALDLENANGGEKIDVAVTDNTLPNFVFQPSENIRLQSVSTKSTFSIITWNEGAIGSDGGFGYAGASDVGGTWTFDMVDLDDTESPGDDAGTDGDSGDFKGVDGWEAP